ncbi:MAG: hypothetical protein SGJ20_07270 [Planctomycetota bacterium]|nr:hypothetical protein [Planctomycetota bacterium]
MHELTDAVKRRTERLLDQYIDPTFSKARRQNYMKMRGYADYRRSGTSRQRTIKIGIDLLNAVAPGDRVP